MNSLVKKKDSIYYVALGLIAIMSLFVWRYITESTGIENLINVDDVASIQFAAIGDGVWGKLYGIVKNDPTNVPLFYLLLYIWMEVFGYEPNTLHLLPQIIASMSVFVMGLIGKKISGKRFGLLVAIIAATSIQVIYASFQVRAYSLLILGSAIVFLVWLNRNEKWTSQVAYVFALWLLSFSHFFGVLFCFSLGLLDLIKVIRREQKFSSLLPYVVYCLVYVPYLLIAFIMASNVWGAFWPPVPDYIDLVELLVQLLPLGNAGVFIFFSVLIVFMFNYKKKEIQIDSRINQAIGGAIWSIVIVLLIAFVYSRYINPTSSVWVYRYFLVLYPCAVITVAYGLYSFVLWIEKKANVKEIISLAVFVAFAIVLNYQNVEFALNNPNEINTGGKEFKAVADYLLQQEDIDNETTLVYFPYPDRYFDGWIEFYSKGYAENIPNMCCTVEELYALDITQYDTIYTVGIVYDLASNGQEYIDENFVLVEAGCNEVGSLNKYIKQ